MNLRALRAAMLAALISFSLVLPAMAQWQVPSGAYAIGRGSGTGFNSLLCGSAELAVGQAAAAPICRSMSGDATFAATGALTLATVNANVGSFGSATQCVTFTTNAKGLITAASHATCTPAVGSITGFGTGVATWLATPSSANLASALTDETGSGAAVFGTSPTFSGTPDFQQAITFTGDISPSQITADQNDYAPTGFSTASVLRLSTDASRTITGLAGGGDGRLIYLYNAGSNNLVLSSESASSTAANRFGFSADRTLSASDGVTLLYDPTASRWRLVGSNPSAAGGGGGDFVGPASSTDNAAVRFDGTTGKLGQNSPLIIADTTGALSRSGNGGIPIQATNTNDSAAAGDVGEYTSNSLSYASRVTMTTEVAQNITSISLTAGDWDLTGQIKYESTGAPLSVYTVASLSTTTGTTDQSAEDKYAYGPAYNADVSDVSVVLPNVRQSLSATTTIYLVGVTRWSGGSTPTVKAWGIITARRRR